MGWGGGTQICFCVVLTRVLEVLTMLEGVTKCFHPQRGWWGGGGGINSFTLS